jgi:hypothetical protein
LSRPFVVPIFYKPDDADNAYLKELKKFFLIL